MVDSQQIQLLAFDLDGTLVDSAQGIVDTVNQVLVEHGFAGAEYRQIAPWIGLPLQVFWERLTDFGPENYAILTERYRTIYREIAIPSSRLFAGVAETISELKSAGYRLTIASSKITPVSAAVLQQVGLFEYFDLLMGNDSVTQPKPHAEMLEKTLASFGLNSAQALMIGDTTHDITLGHNAQVASVAVTTGTHDVATLSAAQPAAILNQLSELPAWLAQSAQR
ncbi:HAD-IA family hydrolase [Herpetosiphon giganteus]|uniref:HAD-IA family hydrolase n=1 Tax=Herpetosiphon giganteus TaxID=2029754 RepID=UPI00195B27C3|nr:phosphoglycolate phosphatase [Herpetosiphon giganteus]